MWNSDSVVIKITDKYKMLVVSELFKKFFQPPKITKWYYICIHQSTPRSNVLLLIYTNTAQVCNLITGQANEEYRYCRIWGFHNSVYEEYYLLGYQSTEVSEEYVASIFRIEEEAEQETSLKESRK
jgi:hypothetical protein